jgi:hypothetical protein
MWYKSRKTNFFIMHTPKRTLEEGETPAPKRSTENETIDRNQTFGLAQMAYAAFASLFSPHGPTLDPRPEKARLAVPQAQPLGSINIVEGPLGHAVVTLPVLSPPAWREAGKGCAPVELAVAPSGAIYYIIDKRIVKLTPLVDAPKTLRVRSSADVAHMLRPYPPMCDYFAETFAMASEGGYIYMLEVTSVGDVVVVRRVPDQQYVQHYTIEVYKEKGDEWTVHHVPSHQFDAHVGLFTLADDTSIAYAQHNRVFILPFTETTGKLVFALAPDESKDNKHVHIRELRVNRHLGELIVFWCDYGPNPNEMNVAVVDIATTQVKHQWMMPPTGRLDRGFQLHAVDAHSNVVMLITTEQGDDVLIRSSHDGKTIHKQTLMLTYEKLRNRATSRENTSLAIDNHGAIIFAVQSNSAILRVLY